MNHFTLKSMKSYANPIFWALLVAWGLGSCSAPQASLFEVQRPAKIALDARLKTLFIDPASFDGTNDRLGLKDALLQRLKSDIERQGRFKVVLGKVAGVDLNLEPVAVIQGSVTSKEGSETGQFTEIATCEGGLGGLAAGLSQIDKKQGVTVSQRGLICRSGDNTESAVLSAGIGMLTSMATGEKQRVPPKDSVVRVYRYKNLNFYAQLDISVTYVGQDRRTLTIASESSNFSRHLVQPAVNVHDTSIGIGALGVALGAPVFPVVIEQVALAQGSNPGHAEGRWTGVRAEAWEKRDLPPDERAEVISQLVRRIVQPVMRRVTPYKETIEAQVAPGGSVEVEPLLVQGQWKEVKDRLAGLQKKTPADLYNLGLAFEGGAASEADYVQAQEYYRQALEAEENKIFAEGIGRMERRLAETRALKDQMEVKG
ncbi:MAG: hypothetical protein RRB13_10075 [bacterium]|nr:hypothetical protein [bacterium]